MKDHGYPEEPKLVVDPEIAPRPGSGLATVTAYLRRQWRLSYLGSRLPTRFCKFLVVGGVGIIVNLLTMIAIIQVAGYRDWRASTVASSVAALHNYLFNNFWTFRDRRRIGSALFTGAFLYLPMAGVGIAITTVTYSMLAGLQLRAGSAASATPALLATQLVAILVGTYLNYTLNKLFTWRREYQE
jgi:dolichol-phosphate mannosyltransferase